MSPVRFRVQPLPLQINNLTPKSVKKLQQSYNFFRDREKKRKRKRGKKSVLYLLKSKRDFPGAFEFFLRLIAGNDEKREACLEGLRNPGAVFRIKIQG